MKNKTPFKISLKDNKISLLSDERFADFEALVENELDVDFSLVSKRIDTIEDFEKNLFIPFSKKEEKIFYRGERVNDRKRPLIPTIFRNREALFSDSEAVADVNADFVFNYYANLGKYIRLYKKMNGTSGRGSMYELCAFSQHYIDVSPFVDFTKSLYVALSFALKGKKVFNDDIVVYTVKIKNSNDYTTDIKVANQWMNDYSVLVFRRKESAIKSLIEKEDIKDIKNHLQQIKEELEIAQRLKLGAAPKAKFIDIPTNDLMRFQQGVFLMLTDFTLSFNSYPTKSIRDEFEVTKWVISKYICKELCNVIHNDAPWYDYDKLSNVSAAFRYAAKS